MQHVRIPRQAPALATAIALTLIVAFGPGGRAGAQAPPAPPVPNGTPAPLQSVPAATPLPSSAPIPSSSPSPGATPTPGGRHRRGSSTPTASPAASSAPEPTATPTSPAFSTLDGTWEVQLQYVDRTEYSYLVIHQTGTSGLDGVWRRNGKEYPFQGSYDGRLIRMNVKEPAGNVTLSGYVEGASDMVGLADLTAGKVDPTAFTAEHRASSRGSVFKKTTT